MKLFPLLLAVTLLPACSFSTDTNRVSQTTNQTVDVSTPVNLTIKSEAGTVRIETWRQPRISLQIRKHGHDQASIDAITVQPQVSGHNVTLQTQYGGGANGEVDEILRVPADTSVDIELPVGTVTAHGLSGNVKAGVQTGTIAVGMAELTGEQSVDLSTTVGTVALTVPKNANATFTVNTQVGQASNGAGNKMGNGSARVNVTATTGSASVEVAQ
jgi:hypothetical protein